MAKTMHHIFRPELQNILDRLSALFESHVVFLSPDGRKLRVGEQRPICEFCNLLQNRLGFHTVCHKLDRKQRKQAAATRGMISYQCHAGLHEAILPVYNAEELLGFVMVGQFRSEAHLPAAICRQWRIEWATEELETAYRRIPRFDPEKIRHFLNLFELLVGFVTDLHLVSVQNRNPLEPVLTYMQEHLEEHPRLPDVAEATFRSPSTLSHQFKRILGKSFKKIQGDLIIEKAKESFRSTPSITVAEVATRLGFDDARYFSRLFRKHTGLSPRAFREQLTNNNQF